MNKHFFSGALVLGAMALAWVGSGFFGSQWLALAMTLVIAAVYAFGALELHRFRQATAGLLTALQAIPHNLAHLGDWLAEVPLALQNPVRLRIEGERIALPGPALTPYLVGLLVMLGMLGTFLGMVATLNGAVFALEGTADLAAIRSAFAAPIKGLGLAFGTSVAGVATSAMLGLMSAISRRERLQASQLLDSSIASSLRSFSLTHQRQETFKALQSQAQALPAVVDTLQALMQQMERMGQQMNERLLSNQENFHSNIQGTYTTLAHAVDQSLRDSLAHSAQVAGDSLKPVLQAALGGMAQEARSLHERLIASTEAQLDGLSGRLKASADSVASGWTTALAQHARSSEQLTSNLGHSLQAFNSSFAQRASDLLESVQATHALQQVDQAAREQQRLQSWQTALDGMAAGLQTAWQETSAQTLAQQAQICDTLSQSAQAMGAQAQASATSTLQQVTQLIGSAEELVQARVASEAQWTAQHGERMQQLSTVLRSELSALQDAEAQRGQAAVQRLDALQAAVAGHLTSLGTALEAPITRLIETASEAPRAAAEVIGQLRQQISTSVVRDNALLEERARIMETLNTLLAGINHASQEQRAVIDALVATSAVALDQAGGQFSDKVDAEAAKLGGIAAQVTASAVEVASLGETFGFAVRSFGDSNDKLIANLQRIEGAMDRAMTRSDDQLAYYVAQAREVIDLSTMSQKEIVEALRQLSKQQALLAEEQS